MHDEFSKFINQKKRNTKKRKENAKSMLDNLGYVFQVSAIKEGRESNKKENARSMLVNLFAHEFTSLSID